MDRITGIWKECTEFEFPRFCTLFIGGRDLFILHGAVGLEVDDRGWNMHILHIVTTAISGAGLLGLYAEKLLVLPVLRGITSYEHGRELGCVTDDGD